MRFWHMVTTAGAYVQGYSQSNMFLCSVQDRKLTLKKHLFNIFNNSKEVNLYLMIS
jgi:hypothetical protein